MFSIEKLMPVIARDDLHPFTFYHVANLRPGRYPASITCGAGNLIVLKSAVTE
ncbi:MAG: hypothetical protein ACR5LG_10940 [Sodalis sp. (in: enterobacteria)]|uniref:hypothetical protein n=1 Tax=Sodalis sp. (in: enterobacteria) TaxID=1898979 RepID=UPI003F2CEF28